MAKTKRDPSELVQELIAHALSLPEAWADHPWGETVTKVGKKVFVFFGKGEGCGFSVKLPESGADARLLPFCEPTGYGLGKSGWISVTLGANQLDLAPTFRRWIEESYRSVAPKKLAKLVAGDGSAGAAARPPAARKKKPAAKTSARKTTPAAKTARKTTKKQGAARRS